MISGYMSDKFDRSSSNVLGANSQLVSANKELEFDESPDKGIVERKMKLLQLAKLVPEENQKLFKEKISEALLNNDLEEFLLNPNATKRTESFNNQTLVKFSPQNS